MHSFSDAIRTPCRPALKSSALLVDLDAQITGKHDDWFIDAGHMTDVILAHCLQTHPAGQPNGQPVPTGPKKR